MNALMALGPNEVSGLPAHVLLVHLTVVALPTAAAATVASAVWPTARRRLGVVTPLIALVALICVPITVSAGEWLYARVGHTPELEKHERLGHGMLPWAIALFVVAAAEYLWFRFGAPGFAGSGDRVATAGSRSDHSSGSSSGAGMTIAVTVLATVLALAVGVGTVVQVYRVGDSGARSAWKGGFSQNPRPNQDNS